MYKEEDLMKAFEKARKGSKDYYEDLCTMLFDEVRRLVSLVYEKESNINKLVNHIFNKLRPRLNEFDPSKEDIHRWISVFSSSLIYSVYNMSNSDVFTYREENSDYEIGYIEEDDEFAECAIYFNRQLSSKKFSKADSVFSLLTKGQIILYEMFCYAGCTVEEIEELLEVDGVYICSELYDIKKILVREYKEATWIAGAPDADTASKAVVSSTVSAEETDDTYDDVNDDTSDDVDDDASDDVDDDASGDMDDDLHASEPRNEYAAYLNGSKQTEPQRNVNQSRKRKKKKSSGLFAMFEQVPDKMMKLIAMILVALILVVVLVILIFFDNGGKKNNNNNVNNNTNNIINEQQNSTVGNNKESEPETTSQGAGKETEGQSQTAESTEATKGAGGNNSSESSKTQTKEATKATKAPETDAPETTAPETKVPESTTPETTVPETTTPGTTAPETTAPETTAPETTAPETTAPESTVAESTVAESTSPESTAPEANVSTGPEGASE